MSLAYQIFFPLLINNLLAQLIDFRLSFSNHRVFILFLFFHGFTCFLGPSHLLEIVQSWYGSVLVQDRSELCGLMFIFDFELELRLWLRLENTLDSLGLALINYSRNLRSLFIYDSRGFLIVIIHPVRMELLIRELILILNVFDLPLILIWRNTTLKCFLVILLIFIRAETKLKCILAYNWRVNYFHGVFIILIVRILILNI